MNSRRVRPPERTEPRTIVASTFPAPLTDWSAPAKEPKPEAQPAKREAAQRRAWSAEEIAFLRKHYSTDGAIFCAEQLGRTKGSVNAHAERLGIRSSRRREWTSREVAMLRLQYGKLTVPQLARMLKRSEMSVRRKIFKLDLTDPASTPWTEDDVMYLVAHFHLETPAVIAQELGRTVDAVNVKAARLKLSRRKRA